MTLSMRVGYAVVRPQKWPGRVRRRLRALRHGKLRLLRLIGARSVRSSYGVRLAANWGDRTFKLCAVGRYGTVLSDFIASIDEPFEFLDIGANQGLYALLAGRNPACTRAIAFEPVARTHGFLRRNIALNDLAERVTPVQAAVSQRRGTAEIALPDGHSGAASLCRGDDRARAETITL
ncbi:MAG: FkbM family methyltransferase, partial [Pseudomonadota bacterium]